MGRCGTMFLADVLARSREFIVRHEHADDHLGWFAVPGQYRRDAHLVLTALRFAAHDNYGEVNSFLRFLLPDLPVDRRAVIVRHLPDMLLSIINRGRRRWAGVRGMAELVDHVDAAMRAVATHIGQGIPVIRFEQMTTDPAELERICGLMGVTDVDVSEVDLAKKVNATQHRHIESLAELPDDERAELRRLDWVLAWERGLPE